MRTTFTPQQLADPQTATSESAIRKCVHCGFCTATCPTYVLLGDELDSPRGRIYLIKDMLENDRDPTAETVKHIDRCLSCLSCMTTCPSDVNYKNLIDHARAYVEQRYHRRPVDRLTRWFLAAVLPRPRLFRLMLALGGPLRGLAPTLARVKPLAPIAAMLRQVPAKLQPRARAQAVTLSRPRGRVLLAAGCAEPVLRPQIRAATLSLLERAGYDVEFARGEGCCGALAHHIGREHDGLAAARRNVDAWAHTIAEKSVDAILITTSGCGSMIKDYGELLAADPAYADKARTVSSLACDISEFLGRIEIPPTVRDGFRVAYHPPCSLQHGQRTAGGAQTLLEKAGFAVKLPAEAHLCCGSAGTYSILQPELAGKLGQRKAANLDRLDAALVVTGNIGCMVQIGAHSDVPVVHLTELLDWATGGPALGDLALGK